MRRVFSVLVVTTAILGVVLGVGPSPQPGAGEEAVPVYETLPTALAISMFQDRVEANQGDVVSATILGELFSRRARETGDVALLSRAESSLEQALAGLPGYPRAEAALAEVYISLHRFHEALELARSADAADAKTGAIVTVGDAQLALGLYEEARETYLGALEDFPTPLISARIAHLDEVFGDLTGARLTMNEAAETFIASGGSGEAAAWIQMRRGDLAFSSGDYVGAEAAYRDSLAVIPGYPGALSGMARSLEAQGDRDAAIEAYEQAVEVQPLPSILLALGELYELDGRSEEAARAYGTLEVVAELSDGLFDLSLVFYEAEHGSPEQAVKTARALVESRPDLFSYDALAWALYRADDLEAAREAADEALRTRPAFASIWYHSGAIWAGLGEEARAAADLEMALALSPRFDPVAASHAKRLLEELVR